MVCEHEKFVSYLISNFVKNKHYGFIILKKLKISYVPHVLSAIVKATKIHRENVTKLNSMKTLMRIFLKYQMETSL